MWEGMFKVHLREIGFVFVHWIEMSHDHVQYKTVIVAVLTLGFSFSLARMNEYIVRMGKSVNNVGEQVGFRIFCLVGSYTYKDV